MDDLVLDAESLFNIADIVEGYCSRQREVVNVYLGQIMALAPEWRDDETFGTIVEEINSLRAKALAVLEEVYETYPKYFRKRAQQVLARPVYRSESTTVYGGTGPVLGHITGTYYGSGGTYGDYGTGNAGGIGTTATDNSGEGKISAEEGALAEESVIEESIGAAPADVGTIGASNETKGNSEAKPVARNLPVTEQKWDKYGYPGGEVYDSPSETGRSLDYDQGQVSGYGNTCGIVSCVNVARLAGLTLEEFEALDIAIKNDLCKKYRKGWFGKVHQGGGTWPQSRQEILKHLGIDSYLEDASIKNIAQRVIEGRGVIISVRAEKLWNNKIKGLHAITVISVQRGYDGSVQGFFVCDSGRHSSADASAFYTASQIEEALTPKRPMNVTTNIIR